MEEFISELNKDMKEILNSIKHCTSKSKQYQLMQDYYVLCEIYEEIGVTNIPKLEDYSHKKIKIEDLLRHMNKKFMPILLKDLEKNKEIYSELVNLLLELFDNYDEPTIYESMFKNKINIYESVNMTIEFLKNYDLKIYSVLKELINNNRVMYVEDHTSKYYGVSYNVNATNKSYILMNTDQNINSSITLVHESGHIYDFDKNKNNSINTIRSHF